MVDATGFTVIWHDSGLEPTQQPDPAFPNGIELDISLKAEISCTVELPYPAKRIGHYFVQCNNCGFEMRLTTAGRTDDPKSLTIPCQAKGTA